MSKRILTDEQLNYIKVNLLVKSVSQIAKDLGVGYMNVYREAEKLGVARRGQVKFSPEDDEYIKKWYGIMRGDELARRLDCDRQTIYNRARAIGCTKKG